LRVHAPDASVAEVGDDERAPLVDHHVDRQAQGCVDSACAVTPEPSDPRSGDGGDVTESEIAVVMPIVCVPAIVRQQRCIAAQCGDDEGQP